MTIPDDTLSSLEEVSAAFSVEDYLYFYRDFLTAQRSDAETEAAVRLLAMYPPMQVLDLACGFGRIANRLAQRGFRVTGVEWLGGFLEVAQQEADQMRGKPTYVQGDMRQIGYDGQFNRVLMMFNSFGYFTDEENLRVMQRVAQALKPGGRLGFDVIHRDGMLSHFQSDAVLEKDGDWLINRFSFDVWTGRLLNDRVVIREGKQTHKPFSIRLYGLTEMRELLQKAGLELEDAYAEWDGQPLNADSAAMVIVARKPE